jgi:hypothetical protein
MHYSRGGDERGSHVDQDAYRMKTEEIPPETLARFRQLQSGKVNTLRF